MRPPHHSRPTPIGGILAEFVATLPQASEVLLTSPEGDIRGVLGKLGTYCNGIRLHEGHLLITTSVPAVAHHLRAHAPSLLHQLRASGLAVEDLTATIV